MERSEALWVGFSHCLMAREALLMPVRDRKKNDEGNIRHLPLQADTRVPSGDISPLLINELYYFPNLFKFTFTNNYFVSSPLVRQPKAQTIRA